MLKKAGARKINNMGTPNLLKVPNIKGPRIHPTEKPVDLMKILIENSSDVGELVLDPFVGSGATLVACKECGRHYIGCEIDTEYYEQALYRLDGIQSKELKKLNGIRLW